MSAFQPTRGQTKCPPTQTAATEAQNDAKGFSNQSGSSPFKHPSDKRCKPAENIWCIAHTKICPNGKPSLKMKKGKTKKKRETQEHLAGVLSHSLRFAYVCVLCVHMLHQQVRQAMAALAKSLPRVHCLLGCHVTQLHWSLALLTDWQHLISFHGSNHSIFSSRRHVGHDQTILVACTGLIFVSMASNHVSMINSQSDKTEKPSGKLYIYIYIYCACTGWHVRSRGVSAVSRSYCISSASWSKQCQFLCESRDFVI